MSLCELSKSFVFTILTKNFGMSFVCARWGPRLLSDNHKKGGCKQVKHFCKNSRLGTKVAWQNYYDWWDLAALLWSQNQKSFSMWEHRGSPPPKKAKVSKSIGKQMYIFLLISTGWFLLTLYPPVRQWMCHTILQLTFYKQYAIFNYLYNNKSTCVFHWILQFKTYCKFMIW